MTKTVVFVCSANLCRSPMAHAIFAAETARRGLDVEILSAGTYDFRGKLAEDNARLTCERHQTPMSKVVSVHVSQVDLSRAVRIFVMEQHHLRAVTATGVDPLRVSLMGEFDPQRRGVEIDDPIGQDSEAYNACYERLHDCIKHYLDTTHDFA